MVLCFSRAAPITAGDCRTLYTPAKAAAAVMLADRAFVMTLWEFIAYRPPKAVAAAWDYCY